MATIASVKIYPSIGVARIGNSPDEFYIGPELPFPAPRQPPPGNTYKDGLGRIKRQGARFRLFGFDAGGNLVQEITSADGPIQWTVHLANKKAAYNQFEQAGSEGGPRNSGYPGPRSDLIIDPGPRTLVGPNQQAAFDTGTFTGVPVPLGNIMTDADGRLIVLGGFGNSDSPSNQPIVTFANNDGWFDDVSDGPVTAQVTISGQIFTALGAWVICPPPKYAPSINSPISLYDVMRDYAVANGLLVAPAQPSFVQDIYPILLSALNIRRVAAASFGPGDHDSLSAVVPPAAGQDAMRKAILAKLANPAGGGGNMPLLYSSGAAPITLTKLQYAMMQQWAAPSPIQFVNDWPGVIPPLTPDGLTRAALETCVGAAFYPGIEASWRTQSPVVALQFPYVEAFRFDTTQMLAGDVTQQMAVPWQADFTDCSGGDAPDLPAWWPAQRPDTVYMPGGTTPVNWTRGLVSSPADMVQNWSKLGFIVDPGDGNAVEVERYQDCFFVVERSTFGADEVKAMLPNALFPAAFWVIVDGFAPSDLGIHTAADLNNGALAPTIAPTPAVPGMSISFTGPIQPEDPSLPPTPQRFRFAYQVSFIDASGFSSALEVVTLLATLTSQSGVALSATAQIELVQKANPFLLNGQTSWLSLDLRVFSVKANQPRFGATMGATPDTAPAFISAVIANLTQGHGTANGDSFGGLPTDEQAAALEMAPTDMGGNPVFNFALAQVRLRGLTQAANAVRVFFRTFPAQTTSTAYDPGVYPDQASHTYRQYSDGITYGHKIPLLGVQGDNYVSVPFFAATRIADMTSQTDTPNIQTITPDPSGAEVDTFYGCWLDINQPLQTWFPILPPSGSVDGPFSGPNLLSIQQLLVRGGHQCLVAEIAFDDESIPPGATPATSDKLAQRNLAFVDVPNPGLELSRRAVHTFEIRPTPGRLPPDWAPDELMIDWGNTSVGSPAAIYLPAVDAGAVLELASTLYASHRLKRIDDHTLQCLAGGVTYVPIPPGIAINYVGLLSVDLPAGVREGQAFTIVVRQITSALAGVPGRPDRQTFLRQVAAGVPHRIAQAASAAVERRRVLGAFQITIPVRTTRAILPVEERTLSLMRWIQEAIPAENRWSLVFGRYVEQIAGRVQGLGGDPQVIGPSPTGDWQPPKARRVSFVGKIEAIVFDRYGDFDGFILDTEHGDRTFASREEEIRDLVEQAWSERIRIEVVVEHDAPHHPVSIIFRGPPPEPRD
jgi:hypothetical protein